MPMAPWAAGESVWGFGPCGSMVAVWDADGPKADDCRGKVDGDAVDLEVKTRVSAEDAAMLRAEAEARKVSVAEVVRQAVTEHLARREVDRAVPVIEATFAKHVDRLAGLIAKTYVAAAASAWQVRFLIEGEEDVDAEEVMRQAVVRAGVDWRAHGWAVGAAGTEAYHAAEDATKA